MGGEEELKWVRRKAGQEVLGEDGFGRLLVSVVVLRLSGCGCRFRRRPSVQHADGTSMGDAEERLGEGVEQPEGRGASEPVP